LTCPFLNKKDEWKVQIVSLLFGARMTYTMWISVSQAMAFMFCLKEMWLQPLHHNSTCQQWSSAKSYLLLVVSEVSKMRRLFKWKIQALISSASFIPALKPSFKVCKR
jgi:hypothetical protein